MMVKTEVFKSIYPHRECMNHLSIYSHKSLKKYIQRIQVCSYTYTHNIKNFAKIKQYYCICLKYSIFPSQCEFGVPVEHSFKQRREVSSCVTCISEHPRYIQRLLKANSRTLDDTLRVGAGSQNQKRHLNLILTSLHRSH